jgi:hypothetical protein
LQKSAELSHSTALRRQMGMNGVDSSEVHIIGGGIGGLTAAAFIR